MASDATGGPSPPPETWFAPAGRDAADAVRRKRALVRDHATLRAVLDAMPCWVFVLNRQRQVVAANAALLKLLQCTEEELVGSRPGEIIGCAHVALGPDGCGSSKHCVQCGAVRAMLQCQSTGQAATGDCRLRLEATSLGAAMELRVTATPVEIGGETFTLVALEDAGDRTRLAVLTRVFFHDVMNTILGLRAHFQLLAGRAARGAATPQEFATLELCLDQLSDEIRSQRELMLAESGELKVSAGPIQTSEFLASAMSLFSTGDADEAQVVLGEAWDGQFTSDRTLLSRVVGNMLRNALEAAERGRKVTLSCRDCGTSVRFSVHNPEVIAEHVQRQVFLRSFSTKAPTGRGIGTHSMKLLGERYLRGRVDFESAHGKGTTFWIDVPKQ
ncbi:MAG: ATP-binding protein [Thermoguttaceae bacterium]